MAVTCGDQKKVQDPQDLGLYMAVKYCMGAGY